MKRSSSVPPSSPGARRRPTLLESFLAEAEAEGAPIDAAETLALAAPAVSLVPAMRVRLEAALDTTNRFDDLEQYVAELADLSIDEARALLLRVDAPSTTWDPSPVPGVDLLNFVGGPRVRDAVTGFVRHAPGTTFPEHDHVGAEHVLVLQGAFEDDDGTVYESGAVATRGPRSAHSYRAIGSLPLITMAVVQGGVIIGGVLIPPGDPRA